MTRRRHTLTPEEARDRRRGWITIIVVAMVALAFFVTLWLIQFVLFLNTSDELE